MKIRYAVLAAGLIAVGASRRRPDRFPAAPGGANVGHFLRGFPAQIERLMDSSQEGDACRHRRGLLRWSPARHFGIETGGNLFNLKIAQILNDHCR